MKQCRTPTSWSYKCTVCFCCLGFVMQLSHQALQLRKQDCARWQLWHGNALTQGHTKAVCFLILVQSLQIRRLVPRILVKWQDRLVRRPCHLPVLSLRPSRRLSRALVGRRSAENSILRIMRPFWSYLFATYFQSNASVNFPLLHWNVSIGFRCSADRLPALLWRWHSFLHQENCCRTDD